DGVDLDAVARRQQHDLGHVVRLLQLVQHLAHFGGGHGDALQCGEIRGAMCQSDRQNAQQDITAPFASPSAPPSALPSACRPSTSPPALRATWKDKLCSPPARTTY